MLRTTTSIGPLFLALFCGAVPAWGQAIVSGEITGSVTDITGALVPAAAVRANNTGTNVNYDAVTNENGLYRLLSLIPGTYTVSVEIAGFKKFVRENVTVSAGSVIRVDTALVVGDTTETNSLGGVAPMVKTDTADVSQTIGRRESRIFRFSAGT